MDGRRPTAWQQRNLLKTGCCSLFLKPCIGGTHLRLDGIDLGLELLDVERALHLQSEGRAGASWSARLACGAAQVGHQQGWGCFAAALEAGQAIIRQEHVQLSGSRGQASQGGCRPITPCQSVCIRTQASCLSCFPSCPGPTCFLVRGKVASFTTRVRATMDQP